MAKIINQIIYCNCESPAIVMEFSHGKGDFDSENLDVIGADVNSLECGDWTERTWICPKCAKSITIYSELEDL